MVKVSNILTCLKFIFWCLWSFANSCFYLDLELGCRLSVKVFIISLEEHAHQDIHLLIDEKHVIFEIRCKINYDHTVDVNICDIGCHCSLLHVLLVLFGAIIIIIKVSRDFSAINFSLNSSFLISFRIYISQNNRLSWQFLRFTIRLINWNCFICYNNLIKRFSEILCRKLVSKIHNDISVLIATLVH